MSSYGDVLSTGITRYGIIAVVVTTVLSVLAAILAVMRFMLRRKVGFGTDDYLLMVVLLFLMIQLIIQYLMAFLAAEGASMEYLAQHPEKMIITLKLIYFPVLSYTLVVVFIKTSILYSYKNIFGHVKMTKYHIYILLGLTWAWGLGSFLPALFQCSPIDKAWLPMKPGHCIGLMPYLWATSISNFIIDWLILIVPIAPVLKLHLPPTQKLLVGLSFMCGSIACIASTVRSARTGEFDPANLGVSNFNASIWVYIEIPLATISCCLPFLSRPLGTKIARSLRTFRTRITGRTSKDSSPANSKGKSSGWGSYDSSPETMNSQSYPIQGLSHDGRNIHLSTTTTVDSRPMPNPYGTETVSYGYTVEAPAKGRDKSDSERSLV
ncbi:hypothetical protein LA080_007400 [Diaporthe eres]|uniref:Rhodopsin domain-containing protein n=1 Tax=Diaporthe vaccinii TaxID=105482 RepID=A0ABR4DW12_9PEZI|nr:hypothetical protein LA080_007400 [Diaporthe eres]